MKDNEPWFVAKDVCIALEIANPTDVIKRLDEDERARFNLGRQGQGNIVNEPGLYSLILGSRKPQAKAFKRWITHDDEADSLKQGLIQGLIDSIRNHTAFNAGSFLTALTR